MKPDRLALRGALLASTVLVAPLYAQAQAQQPDQGAAEQQTQQAGPDAPVEEIVVTGEYIPEEKRATSEIANLVDAEDFAITGDANAATALRRVTGLSLVGDGFIFVRGLGERYSKALLNGAELPSPLPLQRVVPLDAFPTSFLEGVLVQKTYSPEFPSEFGGGVIELRSAAIPQESFLRLKANIEYDTESSFQDGLSYQGGDTDILGIDDGTRELPEIINRTPLGRLEQTLNPQQLEVAGEALPRIWSIDSEPNAPNVDFGMTFGERFELNNGSALGILGAVDYGSSFQNKFGARREVTVGANDQLTINENFSPGACNAFENSGDDCGFRSTEWTIELNGILSVGYEINRDHTVKANTLILRNTTRDAAIEKGVPAFDPGTLFSLNRIDWVEQQLWTNQLIGEHYFDFLGGMFQETQINWYATWNESKREAPLRRTFVFRQDADDVFRLPQGPSRNRTTFVALDDNVFDAGFDVVQPMSIFDRSVDVKFGFAYFDKERDTAARRFSFDLQGLGALLELRTLVPELIFTPGTIDPAFITLQEATRPSDRSSSSFTNWQGYAAIDAQVLQTLRVSAGFRVENSTQTIDTVFVQNPFFNDCGDLFGDNTLVVGGQEFCQSPDGAFPLQNGDDITTTLGSDTILPAVTVTWEFFENMQLRGGFSQTLGRPSLRELSAAAFLDPDRDEDIFGNPLLGITEFDNYDLRWEWYFGPGEVATVGAFYKELENPVERTFVFFGQGPTRTFINADSAELWGIEAEIEKIVPLGDWIGGDFFEAREFFIKLNGTFVDAESTLPAAAAESAATNRTRRLTGQSKWIGNGQLGWTNLDVGERFAILVNFTGDRIQDIGVSGAPDAFEDPPILLGLNYSREVTVGNTILEFSFEADNLLGDDFLLRQGDIAIEEWEIGRQFQLGVEAKF